VSTCIHCDTDLGKNHLLPEYPVGKQLAFDPANSRIWAVCPKCDRWNLSWLDEQERAAAIARLEQYFSAAPQKAAIEGIALANVAKTKLIRIGAVEWPSFAGWRYARRIENRRQYFVALVGLMVAAQLLAITPWGQLYYHDWAPYIVGFLAPMVFMGNHEFYNIRRRHKLRRDDYAEAKAYAIEIDDAGWRLFSKNLWKTVVRDGPDASRWLTMVLPYINYRGFSQSAVASAIETIVAAGGPARYVAHTLSANGLGVGMHQLKSLPPVTRAALEIALNEEAESRALRGDLAAVRLERESAQAIAGQLTS
jgi:hypothetical protein